MHAKNTPDAEPDTSPTSAPFVAPVDGFSWFLIFLTPALWSVNYLIGRTAPAWIAPHALACSRWLLAALILGLFAWPELKAKRHLVANERWHFLVLGLLGMWVCGAWMYMGSRTSPTNNLALIYTTSPVFIVLGASLFLHERVWPRQWLGIGLALLGLMHVVIRGQWHAIAQTEFVAGDFWILGCAVAWAIYSILLKRWPSAFSPIARLVLIALAGALVMLPLTLLEAWSGLPMSQTHWGWQTASLVLAAAIFPGAGAYFAYATLQKRIGASRTALVLYLGPLYAAALAWFALGEPLHSYHAVGAAILLPGLYLASQSGAKA